MGRPYNSSMRIDVVSLFPEFVVQMAGHGVVGRATERGLLSVHGWNPRDYADGNYRRVDDRPFGGGPGMVMMIEPLQAALAAVRAADLMVRSLDTGVLPQMYRRAVPVVWPPTGTGTADTPMRDLEALARRIEADHPDIWAVNVVAGFSFADVADAAELQDAAGQ